MKKLVVAVIIICMCINFSACGKSEEAQNIDDLILSIGEVTLDSKDTIIAAQERYNMLSDRQKKYIENYQILSDALEVLSILESQKAIREENRLKVLNWIVDNGTAIKSGGINTYGQIVGYYYYYKTATDSLKLSFDLEDGQFDAQTGLEISRDEDIEERSSYEIRYYTTHYIGLGCSSISYRWAYYKNTVVSLSHDRHAIAAINGYDISKISRGKTDIEIDVFDSTWDFQYAGYSDKRAAILEDLYETLDLLEEFLTMKVGIDIADIGFTSYS